MHGAAEDARGDANKVSILNAVAQNNIQHEDEMKITKTRMRKLEEDNIDILRKLDDTK